LLDLEFIISIINNAIGSFQLNSFIFIFGFFELFRLNEAIVANFAYEPLGE